VCPVSEAKADPICSVRILLSALLEEAHEESDDCPGSGAPKCLEHQLVGNRRWAAEARGARFMPCATARSRLQRALGKVAAGEPAATMREVFAPR
jgi:hypothetical protein